MTTPPTPDPEALILEMLREVLARQARQMGLGLATPIQPARVPPPALPPPAFLATPTPFRPDPPAPPEPPPGPGQPAATDPPRAQLTRAERATLQRFAERAAEPTADSRLTAILRTVVVGLLLALVLINLPVFGGTALARALPDRQSLIVRDGLVIKGPGPEIYVIEASRKRWISSLEAFSQYGYEWDVVHVVDEAFLAQFPDGRPIHLLIKCSISPHVFRLEGDQKRWIKDIPTFVGEGHAWSDVRVVDCNWLRDIPNGPSIPPEAGPPPEP